MKRVYVRCEYRRKKSVITRYPVMVENLIKERDGFKKLASEYIEKYFNLIGKSNAQNY